MEKEQHIRTWIERTSTRLQQIQNSEESLSEKRARAAMNISYLLGEIVAPAFPGETETQLRQLVSLYMNIER